MRLRHWLSPAAVVLAAACSSSSTPSSPSSPSPTSSSPPAGADAGTADASTIADASAPDDASSNVDACPVVALGTPRSIHGDLALTTDAMGAPFGTQNGSVVHIAAADLVGKTLVWATVPGGEQIANVPMPTEFGVTTIRNDLTAHFDTTAKYTNGPWELAVFVSVTGGDFTMGPKPGDIAAFDLTPPPACQPPVTGVSIRVTIDDADATVKLGNASFIRF